MAKAEAYTEPRATANNWAKGVQLALLLVAFVLLFALARPMLGWLRFIFNEPSEDMGHGWLVPLFSLYLLWKRRERLAASVDAPSWAGLLLSLLFMALLWLGERGQQARISQIAIYGLLWALPYACLGRRFAAAILFPVVFLAFTIPIGFLDFFTVRLRMLTALFSSILLNGVGIPVARVGTGLHSLSGGGFALDVADPCSGLRSIFALSAITAAYGYLTLRTRRQKWLLFACSLPLAVLGNMARIFSIALVARFFGQRFGTGFYHDYSGYLVFIVGTLLMLQAGGWIARLDPVAVVPDEAAERLPAGLARISFGRWAGIVVLILALATMRHALRVLPPPTLEPQNFLVQALPDLPNFRVAKPWFCQNEQCRKTFESPDTERPTECPVCGGPVDEVSLGERTVLPPDTRFLKGNYYDAYGNLFRVSVVINGASRQSIHRPELCLPAQGFSIEHTREARVPLASGESLAVKWVDLRRIAADGSSRALGQVYGFVSADHQTASHYARMLISVRDRALFNRVTRWAMVVVVNDQPLDAPDRRQASETLLRELYPALRAQPPQL